MNTAGLGRLGTIPSDDGERDALLRTLVRAADAEFANGYSLHAGLSLGAIAEELGFPEVAERYFTWTRAMAQFFRDPTNAVTGAGAPVVPRTAPAHAPPEVLGFILFLAGRFAEARHHFALAADASPDDVAAALHLARTQVILGEDPSAVIATLAPHAAATSARGDEARKELACALFRAGDPRADAVAAEATRAERTNAPAFEAELERAVREGSRERPEELDEYHDEQWQFFAWNQVRTVLASLKPHEDRVAFAQFVLRETVRSILRANPAIASVIEFGVWCGQSAFQLAGEFPTVAFVGVDRSEAIRNANDRVYARENLRFVAAGIEAFLRNGPHPADVLLVHARTVSLLYPAGVRALYAAAAHTGIRRVALVEDVGISRTTGHFTRFSETGRPSIPLRQPGCFAHDYERYLREAGYETRRSDILPITTLWKAARLTDAHLHVVEAELRTSP